MCEQIAAGYAESAAEARAAMEAQQLATAHTHVAREVHEKKVAVDAIAVEQLTQVAPPPSTNPFQSFKTALFG